MKKAPNKCVFKRENGTYYFRRAVPKELVGRIGKREWKVSLKTTEYGRAHAEGAAIFERTERQIAQLRGTARSADPIEAGLPASDEQVETIAAAVFSRSATMTIGRFEGHVFAGRVQGNAAAETLQKLEAEWASLQGFRRVKRQQWLVTTSFQSLGGKPLRIISATYPQFLNLPSMKILSRQIL